MEVGCRRVILAPHDVVVDRRDLDLIIESMQDGAAEYGSALQTKHYSYGLGYCGRTIQGNLDELESMRDRARTE